MTDLTKVEVQIKKENWNLSEFYHFLSLEFHKGIIDFGLKNDIVNI